MIPFPLPPTLRALHEALEHYAEAHEEGFFLAEQDRSGQARAQPVLIFIRPESMRAEPDAARHPPDWIGIVSADAAGDAAADPVIARYARAGVRECWRVVGAGGEDATVRVLQQPGPAGYADEREFRGAEPIVSETFPELVLRPADLNA